MDEITVPRVGTVFKITESWEVPRLEFYHLWQGRFQERNEWKDDYMRVYSEGTKFKVKRVNVKKGNYMDFIHLYVFGKNIPKEDRNIFVLMRFFTMFFGGS